VLVIGFIITSDVYMIGLQNLPAVDSSQSIIPERWLVLGGCSFRIDLYAVAIRHCCKGVKFLVCLSTVFVGPFVRLSVDLDSFCYCNMS